MIDLFQISFLAVMKFHINKMGIQEEQNEVLTITYTIINKSKEYSSLQEFEKELSNFYHGIKKTFNTTKYSYNKNSLLDDTYKVAKEIIKGLEIRFEIGYIKKVG